MSKNTETKTEKLTVQEVYDTIINFSYAEVLELADLFKEKTGISGSQMFGGNTVAATGSDIPVAEAEPTEFDVFLEQLPDDKKIAGIKMLRDLIAGLGIKEAKEMIGELPLKINQDGPLPKDTAEGLAAQVKEKLAGNGVVLVKQCAS